MKNNFADLVETFAILRGPNGCPWDKKQTHESLIKNLREETEELIAAIEKKDPENMKEELKETVLKVAEFSNEDKLKLTRRMNKLFIGGFVAAVIYMILVFTDNADNFLGGLCLGITFGMMIVGVIMTSKYASKIRECKMRLLHKLK